MGWAESVRDCAGGCHCGAMRFRASADLSKPLRCNCSMCAMRGAVMVHAKVKDFAVLQGEDQLSEYTFGTGAARYRFCRICGVYVFHRTRSNPDEYAVNVACIDGFSPFDFAEVPVLDGQRHPGDSGGVWRWAGTIRFEPSQEPER